jgi:uncharacterized membrane protein (UPF0127 family)
MGAADVNAAATEGVVIERASGLRRLRGLAFSTRRRALWIARCRSVHTFGMRYPLDLVWLDTSGRVVRVDLDVAPRQVRACRGARSVVEVPSPGS